LIPSGALEGCSGPRSDRDWGAGISGLSSQGLCLHFFANCVAAVIPGTGSTNGRPESVVVGRPKGVVVGRPDAVVFPEGFDAVAGSLPVLVLPLERKRFWGAVTRRRFTGLGFSSSLS
jgi:hypothetical protein